MSNDKIERNWERVLGDSVVKIRRPEVDGSSDVSKDDIRYRVTFPAEAGGIQNFRCVHHYEADWTANLESTGSNEDDRLWITVPDGTCYDRLPISSGNRDIVVYLPDATTEKYCQKAIHGDEYAARKLVNLFSSPVQIPFICGTGLSVDRVTSLVSVLAEADTHAGSRLHAYRYALVRGALVSPTGFSINSKQEFENFVDSLDAANTVGSVTLVESIADILTTVHSNTAQTVDLLEQLGYETEDLLFQNTGRLFCSFLAKDVLTYGIDRAHGRAMDYHWGTSEGYEQAKAAAKSTLHSDRAQSWRDLICAAARESIEEFAYVLANALYWSGEATTSSARTEELLFAAAAEVAETQEIPEMMERAKFNQYRAAGHRRRSERSFELAKQRFDAAKSLATDHSFLSEHRPIYEIGIVRAHAASNDQNHRTAVTILEQTIYELTTYDFDPDQLAYCIRHLEAQKSETKAKLTEEYDVSDRATFLEVAKNRYETIGFERSVARVDRRLGAIQKKEPSGSDIDDESSDSADPQNDEQRSDSTTQSTDRKPASGSQSKSSTVSQTQESSASGNTARSSETQPVQRKASQSADDQTPRPDSDELGSIDYSVLPEDRDNDEKDDFGEEYIF